jgi:uncharacterized alpha/beta hydrolase family protein
MKMIYTIHVNIKLFYITIVITLYLYLDRWSDNAMDTKQVIDEFQLDTGYDQFIGIGHSFGATSMYVFFIIFINMI